MAWAVYSPEKKAYYNPNVRGDRVNPTFSKKMRLYATKGHAKRAVAFCASGVNNHWCPPTTFEPVVCVLEEWCIYKKKDLVDEEAIV